MPSPMVSMLWTPPLEVRIWRGAESIETIRLGIDSMLLQALNQCLARWFQCFGHPLWKSGSGGEAESIETIGLGIDSMLLEALNQCLAR